MNRQKMLLLVFLLLLAAAVVYAYFRSPQQKTVARLKFTPGIPAEEKKGPTVKQDDRKLHLELLDRQMLRYTGFKRNIFWLAALENKKKLPLPPPPPFRPLPPPPPLAPPKPPPPQVQSSPARTEMAKFTFLGFLKKDNNKTIFLAKDNEIFLVKKGDKIAKIYEVTNITDDVLTINAISGGGQIIIPLVENMPLMAPAK
ncbi:MAG TPA: hypothetical protein VI298_17095 [Geobacteraceae bacterium]